jgi:hypothetical protein
MEIEAKITDEKNKNSQKIKFWIFEWDRSKYKLMGKRFRTVFIVLFSFFLGFTLISAMNRIEEIKKSAMTPPSTYSIPTDTPLQVIQDAESSASHKPASTAAKAKYSGPQVIYRAIAAIPPGTLVKAKLITGASDGPVRAELTQDVTLNGERLIESGSTIMGSGSSTEERLMIRFDRLVKKDGTTMQIQAQAFDAKDQLPGIKGNRVSTEAVKLAAGIGLNFVGGMSDALQETEVKSGVAVKSPSLKNAFLNGAARAALDQSRDLISSYKDKAPRIEVERFRIIEIMWD